MAELAQTYQKKSEKEHILSNPDTYIGSIDTSDASMWVYFPETNRIVNRVVQYNPGLYKLFDEAIVNCRDHVIRMKQKNGAPVTYIDVSIDEATGRITMTNDGNGIDVEKHPEHNVWIPELVFAHLRTSTNYNKSEKKIVGGKNGFGSSLILIWSVDATIETVDSTRKLKYVQSFQNNLDVIGKPSITKCSSKSYTRISFIPDYVRLGFSNGLTPQMASLLHKRVFDISAVTDKDVKVKYNSNTLAIKTFKQYIDMYLGKATEGKRVYEENGVRWEYAVGMSPHNEFAHVTFVNGIYTSKGGKHVEYILGQIVRKCMEFIETKKKVKVSFSSIKEQLILFLRCDIDNPSFDSQTKDTLTTPSNLFGSTCHVTDTFIKSICTNLDVMSSACAVSKVREDRVAKKTDGTKTSSIRGIVKYDCANWAGTAKSDQCTLILCEGDSAKAGILSGLSPDDRNRIGVYPLKGKLLNVRGETRTRLNSSEVIVDIKTILGLEYGKKYNSLADIHKNLRYSKVLFITDQDLDGSHIKGLCINLFACEWASLMQINGFFGFMNTPILKATKGAQPSISFYNEGEYVQWKQEMETTINGLKGWSIKYYKGLGTSVGKEFRQYFKNKKIVEFEYTRETTDDTFDMVFNKKRADERKTWLGAYNRDNYLNTNTPTVSYDQFVHNELIHFSKHDCDRSIPNLVDGLKTSLRKILYSAFKRNLSSEIKVAQFSGYVSEHSCYHHGEMSLNQAIVGMAQTFVGSNNISLLYPAGQFGTRLQGGKDSASPRYIFTRLEQITRALFPDQDRAVLNYLDDDGTSVEPVYYVPIIPMVVVNGTKGIGTGFSTEIMSYNPIDICDYILRKLGGEFDDSISNTHAVDFMPYYEGFKGTTKCIDGGRVLFKGVYHKVDENTIRVTELPIGSWTQDYKEFLEKMEETTDKNGKKLNPLVKNFSENNSDSSISFAIVFSKGRLAELENMAIDPVTGCNGIEKHMKLYSVNSTTNMHLFDADEKLRKYDTIQSIIDDYFVTRLKYYGLRKDAMMRQYEAQSQFLSNKSRYIQELLDGSIDLRRKKKEEITAILQTKKFNVIDNDMDYKYLTKMPMDSVSDENVVKLTREFTEKQQELEHLRSQSVENLWVNDITVFKAEYVKYRADLADRMVTDIEDGESAKSSSKPKKIGAKKSGGKK